MEIDKQYLADSAFCYNFDVAILVPCPTEMFIYTGRFLDSSWSAGEFLTQ